MGYTTKVLALKRTGFGRAARFTCSGLAVGISCRIRRGRIRRMFPTITDLNDLLVPNMALHCHAPGSCSLCLAILQVSIGFRLFRIVEVEREIRAEGKGAAVGQKNAEGSWIKFVAGDCV